MDRLQRYGETTSSPIFRLVLICLPNDAMPPPSKSMSLPEGSATKMLSPWPTSMAVISSVLPTTAGGNGCQIISTKRAATPASDAALRMRHSFPADDRLSSATGMSAPETAAASQTGGGGIRQLGSRRECHSTTNFDMASRYPQIHAGTLQPVKTAMNPTGITILSSGTTKALAERPEKETRWK